MTKNNILLMALVIATVQFCPYHASADDESARAALSKYIRAVNGPGAEVRGPLSVEEIEKWELAKVSKYNDCPQVPFGYINARWVAMKSKIHPGDKLYFFITNKDSWKALAGSEGYVLLREGILIDKIITRRS